MYRSPEAPCLVGSGNRWEPMGTDRPRTDPHGANACPRCGSDLHPLADLVKLAKQTSARAAHGLEALENRRLAVPSAVPVALQECRLDCRILAERLACHAGTCGGGGT